MSDSRPASPAGSDSDRASAAATGNDNDAFSGATGPAKRSSAPKRETDPVVKWLTWGILGVIIIWLAGMLGAMVFGLFSTNGAPRTSAERDLRVLTATVQSGKADAKTYAQYVGVLISAGQLSKAQQALDDSLKTVKTDKSFLYAQQASLYLARKDYAQTVKAADKAMAEAQAELKAMQDANVKNNRNKNAGVTMPQSFQDAALAKAQALVASEDWAGAVKAFNLYLGAGSIDSDVLVQRGMAEIKTGDKKAAEADFKAALKFVPDYQPALDGLKQIGAAQ